MKVINPGHEFELLVLDQDQSAPQVNHLIFVKRDAPPEKYPGNVGHHPGTTVQETMRGVIARLRYCINQSIQMGDDTSEDEVSIVHAQFIIWQLERRNARHKKRVLKAEPDGVELLPVCVKCGHIECEECQLP